jgi:hypothetical protein
MTRATPEVTGTLSRRQLGDTAAHIASQQLPSGLIPWFDGHHADPWDHIESAMALTVCGFDSAAQRAFAWSRANQSDDGTWPMQIDDGVVTDASVDTNQCAYIAVGVWHRWLITRDRSFVDQMWPVVRRAIEFVVGLQLPSGGIAWARDGSTGVPHDCALLTGSSCLVLSLRCALALADLVDDPQPDWELSVGRLAHAVATHPAHFADKRRYAMDWYYPMLGGAVTGEAARQRLDERWNDFVVPGRGIRCVDDAPWVTAAETCELVLVLCALNEPARARAMFTDVQFLRAADGGYWTGWVLPDDAIWPEERSTWTGGAVVLAADAIARCTPAHGIFRGDGLARLLEFDADDCETCCRALTSDLT